MKRSIEQMLQIPSSEITPKSLYLSRGDFLKTMGILTAGTLMAACAKGPARMVATPTVNGKVITDELGDPLNTWDQITHYNNYYEFTNNAEKVAELASNLKTSPWQVEVGGLVQKPRTYDIDDLKRLFPVEERIYRLRCVEAWSMVIPWNGFPLSSLLKQVEPTSAAKYVRFETLLDPKQMPGTSQFWYPWPYQEGLRLDEAMHDLTLLATGLYGEALPPQDGAPIRLVVPWKYGFKSIKAIIKIELVADQPATLWSSVAPKNYGFYSNVNPIPTPPGKPPMTERRIGETSRRETLIFNGYAEQVAGLYAGMDLSVNF